MGSFLVDQRDSTGDLHRCSFENRSDASSRPSAAEGHAKSSKKQKKQCPRTLARTHLNVKGEKEAKAEAKGEKEEEANKEEEEVEEEEEKEEEEREEEHEEEEEERKLEEEEQEVK